MGAPSGNGMERIPKRKRTYRNRLHMGYKNRERERSETEISSERSSREESMSETVSRLVCPDLVRKK